MATVSLQFIYLCILPLTVLRRETTKQQKQTTCNNGNKIAVISELHDKDITLHSKYNIPNGFYTIYRTAKC